MVTGTRVSHTGVMTQDMTFNLCFLQPWSQHINDCDSRYVGVIVDMWVWYVSCFYFYKLGLVCSKTTSSELSYNPG